ncbi:hypothetical protein CC86DRAFT_105448 [Ophiobolus disseminans]|uniref:Heterokaryon incompatibility domain-containing protein n=1 Tax=Ophiobolus disseminans TaxID=1469910 RepID=A0A6A6ZKV1_9PLEO|nr:hypothetical protein CC86DRAFT_105448 [Ophiobolus disseminans]
MAFPNSDLRTSRGLSTVSMQHRRNSVDLEQYSARPGFLSLDRSGCGSRQLHALQDEWDRGWRQATTSLDLQHSTDVFKHDSDVGVLRKSRLWAILDIASVNRHYPSFANAQECIFDIINKMPSPHKPLKSGSIRTLSLHPGTETEVVHCKLSEVSINESAGSYDVFSYCWGPPSQPKKILFLDNRPIVVSDTLFTLLRHYRNATTAGTHWIDGLCMRQDDNEEKNEQIPLMSSIYSQGRRVNIWLGADEDDSGYVLDQVSGAQIEEMTRHRFLRGLDRLLQRPWFGRSWIIQELVLAPPNALVLRSGQRSCSWEVFSNLIQDLRNPESTAIGDAIDARLAKLNTPGAWGATAMLRDSMVNTRIALYQRMHSSTVEDLIRQRNSRLSGNSHYDLPALWAVTRRSNATNPRDHIYSMLGMVEAKQYPNFKVDYNKTVWQVHVDATLLALEEGHPRSVYLLLYYFPVTGPRMRQLLPSWTVNFLFRKSEWGELVLENDHKWIAPDARRRRPIQVDRKKNRVTVRGSIVDRVVSRLDLPLLADTTRILTAFEERSQRFFKFTEFFLKAYGLYEAHDKTGSVWGRESFLASILSMPKAQTHKNVLEHYDKTENIPTEEQFRGYIQEARIAYAASKKKQLLELYQKWAGVAFNLIQVLQRSAEMNVCIFFTSSGLCGLGISGIRPGSVVSVLFHDEPDWREVPYEVELNDDGTYSMVSVAWVSTGWRRLCKHRRTLGPRDITFS